MGWMIAALAVAIVFGILSFVADYRFVILALIWIFIVMPLAIFLLFIIYGMQPLTTFNTVPHKLYFNTDSIAIEFISDDSERAITPKKIDLNNISKIKSGPDYLVIITGNMNKGILILPYSSLPTTDDLNEIFKILSPYLKESSVSRNHENS